MTRTSHYIITRFNLRGDPGRPSPALDSDWLNMRLDLFEKFCLPTVRAQTRTDFSWLWLFDVETPGEVRARIERMASTWEPIRPLFLEPGKPQGGRRAVLMAMDSAPDLLVTTRLDNDDGLARNFVETIRKHSDVDEATVLEFPAGYIWNAGKLYRDWQPRNAFGTLVEPMRGDANYPFHTIYKGSHSENYKLGRVVWVSREPGWLQVVHGSNLENNRRGMRQPMKVLAGNFALPESVYQEDEGGIGLGLDMFRSAMAYAARRTAGSLKRRILGT